ncbi:inhibitor of growth proteins N-terminal histone-binding-domain-containing protein [Chytriomyces sp. MP71]|nr:inhibitor of growth proteins N-terminal histone-binding-domain-containing protein [Chytriomyces sp. MP71]
MSAVASDDTRVGSNGCSGDGPKPTFSWSLLASNFQNQKDVIVNGSHPNGLFGVRPVAHPYTILPLRRTTSTVRHMRHISIRTLTAYILCIAIEALPLELSRNLTLMRELAGLADDVENSIKTETKGFVETLRALPTPEARTAKIANLTAVFKEYLKHGEDKVALAVQTYDLVDRHIRRLDDDLAKYEDERKQISRGDKPSTPQPETAPTGGNVAGAGGARKDKNSRAPGGGGGTGTTTTGSGVAAGKTGRSARSGATGSSSGNGNGG